MTFRYSDFLRRERRKRIAKAIAGLLFLYAVMVLASWLLVRGQL